MSAVEAISEQEQPPKLVLRDAGPGDVALIFGAWLETHVEHGFLETESSRCRNLASRSRLFSSHRRWMTRMLQDAAIVRIACPEDAPNVIFGFAVATTAPPLTKDADSDGVVLHFVYVKKPFRGHRIARMLLESMPGRIVQFTHRTRYTSRLRRHLRGAVFYPYA